MKLQKGFSLLEMMVATVILVGVVAGCISALLQAQQATQAVALMANTQDNVRAGMHFMVQDLIQAGGGIPPGGIEIPNTGGTTATSAINRPGTATIFPNDYSYLPAVIPGWEIGQMTGSISPSTGAVLVGTRATDIINVLYADNTLVDPSGNLLNAYPVVQTAPATPVCAGTIAASGATVTLAPACFTMPGGPVPVQVGNLIMFQNANGTALEYVTGVAGQVISFAGGDPGGLNASGKAAGTVASIMGGSPPTIITRVWMITYYLNMTNPALPQLIRQVNYPNYPAGAPANPPQQIADGIEDMQFTYAITNSTAPGGTYPNGPGDAPAPVLPWDTPDQIRAANVFLAGRSEYAYRGSSTPNFFRDNLTSQISFRNLAFVNTFNTSSTTPGNTPTAP